MKNLKFISLFLFFYCFSTLEEEVKALRTEVIFANNKFFKAKLDAKDDADKNQERMQNLAKENTELRSDFRAFRDKSSKLSMIALGCHCCFFDGCFCVFQA
ncbi:hypothetical protein [Alphaproteobacteria bacterium endosymbiont of Tiliacea citrago]|uniref:hypothetical protein n=1 Tax=Alphaproteobacteria bacterium endosymbiont of Tiliacea citrago TaxID=3077944 RepID=UPI00313A8153